MTVVQIELATRRSTQSQIRLCLLIEVKQAHHHISFSSVVLEGVELLVLLVAACKGEAAEGT